jgi:hypothetical protein
MASPVELAIVWGLLGVSMLFIQIEQGATPRSYRELPPSGGVKTI